MSHIPFQFRRDTAANWTTNDPILKEGEFGLEIAGGSVTGLKSGNGTDAWTALNYLLNDWSGWGAYTNTAGSQALVADTDTVLVNNKGSAIETQKPGDIATFYNGTVISGRNGDGLAFEVEFDFTPDDGTASYISVWIDIGGGIGALYRKTFTLALGAGVVHHISHGFSGYCGATWEANGATVYVRSDGPGVISDGAEYKLTRTHKAR